MCYVSMVMNMGSNFPMEWWNRDRAIQFNQFVEEAKKFDEETGQEDCEDPEKMKLLERIEERLHRIEERLDINETKV